MGEAASGSVITNGGAGSWQAESWVQRNEDPTGMPLPFHFCMSIHWYCLEVQIVQEYDYGLKLKL